MKGTGRREPGTIRARGGREAGGDGVGYVKGQEAGKERQSDFSPGLSKLSKIRTKGY